MKPLICFIGILFPILSLNAQTIVERFDDGDFHTNPQWSGDTAAFVINAANELQLFDQSELIEPKYLSTQFQATDLREKEWVITVHLDFAPSGSNKLRYYLATTNHKLNEDTLFSPDFEAYFIEIGESGSNDGLKLFYSKAGTDSLLLHGGEGLFSSAFRSTVRIKVDVSNKWNLVVEEEATNEVFEIGSTIHEPHFKSIALGIKCFFTSSRRALFYFDNFYFGPEIMDTIPPAFIRGHVIDSNTISLVFSESLDSTKISHQSNFLLLPSGIRPALHTFFNDSLIIHFTEPFISGTHYNLQIVDVVDLANNMLQSTTFEFQFIEVRQAEPKDIIITEFLADPTPVVGLPENEFIELFNNSNNFIDLAEFTIKDNTTNAGRLPSYVFPPKSYLIVCPESAYDAFSILGDCLVPDRWPSLNNGEDSIILNSKEGVIIDALAYARNWINDSDKADGGYSLEIVNKDLPCFDQSNWLASWAELGGTPGIENSVDDDNFLGRAPQLVTVRTLSNHALIVEFDKEIQNISTAPFEFVVNGVIVDVSHEIIGKQLFLYLTEPLLNDLVYELQLRNIANCNGQLSEPISYSLLFDITPPQLLEVFPMADTLLLLSFDENLAVEQGLDKVFQFTDYAHQFEAVRYSAFEILLRLNQALVAEQSYHIKIDSLSDEQGNLLLEEQSMFTYKPLPSLSFNDLGISELMVKPLADNKLPNAEYIEVFNTKKYKLALIDVFLADRKDTVAIPLQYISPGEYLILCPNSKQAQFQSFGRAIGMTPWPSLNNTGDDILLFNKGGKVINEVKYDETWYRDFSKADEGGWSLEIVDTNNPCAGKPNWRASIAESQGTPGSINAVKEAYPDNFGPTLINVQAVDEQHLIISFSESIRKEFTVPHIKIEPSIAVFATHQLGDFELEVVLKDTLKAKVRYQLSASNVSDCVGNLNNSDQKIGFALPEQAHVGDIIINEVLYDPLPEGEDFIELYNRSDKFINLNSWRLQNQNDETEVLDFKSPIIPPYSYLVLTESPNQVIQQYANSVDAASIIAQDIPSLPNNSGSISLLDSSLLTHQTLNYSDEMHSIFYHDTEGVSLERIHPDAPIDVGDSWQSASANVGYATPGKQNSQLMEKVNTEASQTVRVDPPTFSPFQSGRNYTIISYLLHSSGAVATLKVFNTNGQEVKTLLNNQSIGTSGFVRWDGDDHNGSFVGVGYYIIHFSYFTPEGKFRVIKQMVAVSAG